MSENNDISGKNAGDNGKPRELHAGDTETTQAAEAPDNKRFEIMLAGAASLTLIAFLGALLLCARATLKELVALVIRRRPPVQAAA